MKTFPGMKFNAPMGVVLIGPDLSGTKNCNMFGSFLASR